jgi:hypothetical protein
MWLTGIEPDSITDCESIDLEQSSKSGAAESGAVGSGLCQSDSQLQEIIDAWPGLPAGVQTVILKLIRGPESP